MVCHSHNKKRNKSRPTYLIRRASISSDNQMNQIFFDKEHLLQQQPLPSYTSTSTWKSQETKDRDEYKRLRQRVKHIAPEQFKDIAKPSNEPCNIFPQDPVEWRQHKSEILRMASAQKLQDAKAMLARAEAVRKIPKEKRIIISAFGEGAKIYKDGRGPVLSQPTIWSAEYNAAGLPQANWPSFAELQWDGDSRESCMAKTRCGRYLPPPRMPAISIRSFQYQPILKQFALDQTGPIFDSGPGPREVQAHNADMDNDPSFEERGVLLLGTELMEEVGQWRPPSYLMADGSMRSHAREKQKHDWTTHEASLT